jgi:hypothetical protein
MGIARSGAARAVAEAGDVADFVRHRSLRADRPGAHAEEPATAHVRDRNSARQQAVIDQVGAVAVVGFHFRQRGVEVGPLLRAAARDERRAGERRAPRQRARGAAENAGRLHGIDRQREGRCVLQIRERRRGEVQRVFARRVRAVVADHDSAKVQRLQQRGIDLPLERVARLRRARFPDARGEREKAEHFRPGNREVERRAEGRALGRVVLHDRRGGAARADGRARHHRIPDAEQDRVA